MRASLRQVLFRSTAGLDLNFAGGAFSLNNTRTASPAAIPGWSFSRTDTNGTATALDLAGNVIQFPSRTNLLLQSQTFDNASWTKNAATITADAATAPDGTTTADRLVEAASVAQHNVVSGAVAFAASPSPLTASVFFKRSSGSRNIALRAAGASGSAIAIFNGGTGAFVSSVTTGANWSVSGTPAAAEAVADGWFRAQATFTDTETSGTKTLYVQLYDGTTISYSGDGSSAFDIWGAQLELGSTATAYIPTTTAAVTVVLPRITNRGILVEEARTNSLRNSAAAGAVAGTPGTLPTNWLELSLGAGISRQVVGAGTEDGLTYVDMRFFGTTSTSPAVQLNFEQPGIVAASAAQVWTTSCFTKLVAGSLADVSLVTLRLYPRSAVPAELPGVVSSDLKSEITAARARISAALTTPASTATVNTGIAFSVTGTKTLDFTIRLYSPQLEAGAFATSPIITTGAAGTRDMDFPVELLAADASAGFTLVTEGEYTLQQAATDTAVATVASADGAALVGAWRAPSGNAFFQVRTAGIGTAVSYGSLARSGARIIRQATAVQAGNYRSAIDGTLGISATTGTPTGLTRVNIGFAFSTGRPMNGYIRRVRVLPFAATDAQLQALTAP